MSAFVKKNIVPETVTGEEGTAKRNIIRKGGSPRASGRKDATNKKSVDDGSLYVDGSALDEHDPNFDSEDETGFAIPKRAALHRDKIARSKLTLTSYKKKVEPIITFFFVNEDMNDIAGSILVCRPIVFVAVFYLICFRRLKLLSILMSLLRDW